MDAYNANPTSVKGALESLSNLTNSKLAIIGDMFELGKAENIEHQKIVKFAASLNIDKNKSTSAELTLKEARDNFEKEYLVKQLKKNDGNVSKTAKSVGMDRTALHRKLSSLNIKL